jgi:type II secretory pathway component PulF
MYVVEYMHNGKRYEEQIDGTEKDIRHDFFQAKKTIISIKKINSLINKKPKKKEVIAFFSAVGSQMASQVKLVDAITSVIESTKSKSAMYPILKNVKESIIKGNQLSVALEKYKNVFGHTSVTMLASGEESGKLPETLISIAEYIRKNEAIRKDIIAGLIQPITTMFIGLIALFISTAFVIPKITASMGEMMKQKNDGSIFIELLSIISKTPILKELVFYKAYYMVFSSLANMISVGVRLQDSLPVVAKSINVITIRNELAKATELIRLGRYKEFATAFDMIDSVERQMLQTATNEDIIQDSFKRVSERFYETYMGKLKLIGPAIKYSVIMFIVCLIAMMFFGIMLPYISMMGKLN